MVLFDKTQLSERSEKMEQQNDKLKDAALAVTEAGAETLLNNLPSLSGALAGAGLQGAAAVVADGVIGAVAPGIFGAVLGYRARRSERNLVTFVSELAEHIDVVNERLSRLEEKQEEKFSKGVYRDALLDCIIDENETAKVAHGVNAFINVMGEQDIDDSFVLTLFDDLSRLNRLDIRVLNLYGNSYLTGIGIDDDYSKLISEEGIDESQCRVIRQKLCRFGLLESRNEEKRDKNLKTVQDSLAELIKQLSSNRAKKLKAPHYQKLSLSDSYKITPLGNRYLRMIRPVDCSE